MTKRSAHLPALFLAATVFSAVALAGPKPGDIYSSPLKNFRVTVPDYPFGTKVKKSNSKIQGFVTFTSGAGDMDRIGYQRFTPQPANPDTVIALCRAGLAGMDSVSRAALLQNLAGLDSSSREGLHRNIFQQLPGMNAAAVDAHAPAADSMLAAFTAGAVGGILFIRQQLLGPRNARVVSWEPLVLDSTLMVLTVAVSPEGSDNVNLATGKNQDAVFGNLVFIKGGFIYNLIAQLNAFQTGQAAKSSNLQDELAPVARRLVKELYATIVFQ